MRVGQPTRHFLIISSLTLLGGLLASCGSDDTAPTTPASIPQAFATTADPQDFRAFVRILDGDLRSGDMTLITTRMLTKHVVCAERDLTPEAGNPNRCQQVGEEYDGVQWGQWASEGQLKPVADAVDWFNALPAQVAVGASDPYGNALWQVYAINDGEFKLAILSAIIERPAGFAGHGPLRVASLTEWHFGQGRWMVAAVMNAWVLAENFLAPGEAVRANLFPEWERFEQ